MPLTTSHSDITYNNCRTPSETLNSALGLNHCTDDLHVTGHKCNTRNHAKFLMVSGMEPMTTISRITLHR